MGRGERGGTHTQWSPPPVLHTVCVRRTLSASTPHHASHHIILHSFSFTLHHIRTTTSTHNIKDRAVLNEANLKDAVLQRAVFTRSDLGGAVIEGADFTNALVDKLQQQVVMMGCGDDGGG